VKGEAGRLATTDARTGSGTLQPTERVRTGARAMRPADSLVSDDDGSLATMQRAARAAVTAVLANSDPARAAGDALADAAQKLEVDKSRLAADLLDRALCDVRFVDLPPATALAAQVLLVAAFAGSDDASLWVPVDAESRPRCVARSSARPPSQRAQAAARRAVEDDAVAVVGSRVLFVAVPVSRLGAPDAALAVRLATSQERADVERLALVAAPRLAATLERDRLFERSELRTPSLVLAAEKRLVRLAYDLHDGPVQDAVVLREELRLLAADLEPLVDDRARQTVRQGLSSLGEQVSRLADELRELAQSLETSGAARRPLEDLVRREASQFARRTSIECRVDVRAPVAALTDSQRITLYRVTQEALANIAEHSGASTATVRITESSSAITLTVTDDGRGFDPATCLPDSAQRGRLGLAGMAERVRLLGGVFRVTSASGSGTTVRVVLARWRPAADGAATGPLS